MGRYIVKLENCKSIEDAVNRIQERFKDKKNFIVDITEKTAKNAKIHICREDKKEVNLSGVIGLEEGGYAIDYELSYGNLVDKLAKSTTIATVIAAVLGIGAGAFLKSMVACAGVIFVYLAYYLAINVVLGKSNVIFDEIFDNIMEE